MIRLSSLRKRPPISKGGCSTAFNSDHLQQKCEAGAKKAKEPRSDFRVEMPFLASGELITYKYVNGATPSSKPTNSVSTNLLENNLSNLVGAGGRFETNGVPVKRQTLPSDEFLASASLQRDAVPRRLKGESCLVHLFLKEVV